MEQRKVVLSQAVMNGSCEGLFSFIASEIENFIKLHHHDETVGSDPPVLKLGFTFSFPVEQLAINEGILLRWTKGFNIPEAVGQDVCKLLQIEVDKLRLPVRVAALVNDTVGTLMARCYTNPENSTTILGAIFGTGTNGAYVEKRTKIASCSVPKPGESPFMVVNTEWGGFDNSLAALPDTTYDQELDKLTNNAGSQMFEKRVSGMFLGEILRIAYNRVSKLSEEGVLPAFATPWAIDTALLSVAASDGTFDLGELQKFLTAQYGIERLPVCNLACIKRLSIVIGKRSARLAAAAIAGILVKYTTSCETGLSGLDIGMDGSLAEFFPNYEAYIREALRQIPQIGRFEPEITMGIAKDGSGVGAALIASTTV
jgi:hexokinase